MIGLVTCAKYPELTDDDRPVLDALRARGVDARAIVWDDPAESWRACHTLALRSTWDYHLRADDFFAWLGRVEAAGTALWNPPELVRWNMHKRYLRDLRDRGVLVPPTEWVARTHEQPLSTILRTNAWQAAIVKPAISASATDTWITSGDSLADDLRYRELVERSDVLVQEIIPEVASAGEWSLVLIGGEYSHAMIKRPRSGDFRVQTEHGGSADKATPPADIVRAGERIVSLLPSPWLYARIDGVATPRGFMLMEAECIEPVLFLSLMPGAHQRFADAMLSRR